MDIEEEYHLEATESDFDDVLDTSFFSDFNRPMAAESDFKKNVPEEALPYYRKISDL